MQYFDFEYMECFMRKCCGCCKHYMKVRTIAPDYRAPAMGGDEIEEGVCDITEYPVTNRNVPCKQWNCRDGTMVM